VLSIAKKARERIAGSGALGSSQQWPGLSGSPNHIEFLLELEECGFGIEKRSDVQPTPPPRSSRRPPYSSPPPISPAPTTTLPQMRGRTVTTRVRNRALKRTVPLEEGRPRDAMVLRPLAQEVRGGISSFPNTKSKKFFSITFSSKTRSKIYTASVFHPNINFLILLLQRTGVFPSLT
jgi:hypothetical protein